MKNEQEMIQVALKCINAFYEYEYDNEEGLKVDKADLTQIPLAYTESEDYTPSSTSQAFSIEVTVDLLHYRINTACCDGNIVFVARYESLEDLIEKELIYLDFDYLVDLNEAEAAAVAAYLRGREK